MERNNRKIAQERAKEEGNEEEIARLADIVPFEEKYKDILDPEVMQYLVENQDYRKEWEGKRSRRSLSGRRFCGIAPHGYRL